MTAGVAAAAALSRRCHQQNLPSLLKARCCPSYHLRRSASNLIGLTQVLGGGVDRSTAPPRPSAVAVGVSSARTALWAPSTHHFQHQPQLQLRTKHQRPARCLSTTAPASSADSSISNQPPPPLTLRRLSAPFLLLTHPDRSASASSLQSTSGGGDGRGVGDVNLRATQTLNGLIDTVEALYDRSSGSSSASSASSKSSRGRIELKGRYEVEFLVPTKASDAAFKAKKKKASAETIYTRRSVVLTFPSPLIDAVQTIDSNGNYSRRAALRVRAQAAAEIVRLLRVAGVMVPAGAGWLANLSSNEMEEGYYVYDDEGGKMSSRDAYGDALVDEFDFDGRATDPYLNRTRFSGTGADGASRQGAGSRSKYEQSRRNFMDRIDWVAQRRLTDEAMKDAQADLATRNKLGGNEERRERLVSEVLARVIVDPEGGNIMSVDGDAKEQVPSASKDERTDEEKGLDLIHQLIALRRLSLLLTDNYDDLEMERLGKLWEGTSIVLTPSRQGQKDGGATTATRVVESSAAYGIPRRHNPTLKGRESGFKFTYEPDGNVTVHVPVDFEDEELLREMKSNLWDFYQICGDGLDELYPSYMGETAL